MTGGEKLEWGRTMGFYAADEAIRRACPPRLRVAGISPACTTNASALTAPSAWFLLSFPGPRLDRPGGNYTRCKSIFLKLFQKLSIHQIRVAKKKCVSTRIFGDRGIYLRPVAPGTTIDWEKEIIDVASVAAWLTAGSGRSH